MTTDISNSGIGITQFAATQTSSTHLLDKTDSPHSGLFKALHRSMQGNYVIRDASNHGVDIRITLVTGQFKVAVHTAGKGFFNGKLVTIATLSATNITKPSSGAFYHWVRYNSSGTCSVLEGTADAVVPDIGVGFAPIALIKLQHDTTATSDVAIQYFTTSQETNSLSLGYGNSNAYTEMSSITAASGGTTIEVGTAGGDFIIDNTDQDKKIVMRLGTDTSATAFEVRNNSDAVKFAVGGDGSFTGLPVTGVANGVDNRIATFSSASALNGEANLTFDGSTLAVTGALTTTTTATVGTDLTVTGGDVGFGNGQDATISVAATTSTTAGRDLTISAGSTSTNGNDIDGGDLILKSGGGDGTGTSIMTFHTKVSDTDTAAERMRIHTNGNVGIGEAAPSAKLHIMQDTQNTNGLLVEEDTATATASPDVVLYKSKGTGASDRSAANDDLGHFKFRGTDDAGNTCDYADMFAECGDPSNGAEGGYLNLRVASRHNSGSARTLLRLRSNSGNDEVVVNDAPYNNCNFRVEGATDSNLLQTDAANDRVGISTSSPKNILQINHGGGDGNDGIQIVRDDATTAADEILGGIGFDSSDGNVPSSITEASAFIASYATEAHSTTAKGGRLKFGITVAGTADDQTSTVMANLGPPITTSNTTATGDGFNSRATTVIIGAATYAPTVEDSGTLVIFNNSGSNLTLPSINADDIYTGVQFTVFNQTSSTISAQIAVSNSATINGAAATGADDIESFKAATFVCSGNNTWIRIG